MTELRHAVLDVVEFLTASGRWPAGTTGTVVEAHDQRALVEITDDRGQAPLSPGNTPPGEPATRALDGVPALGNVVEQVEEDARARDLRALLALLPEAQREVITLAYYGELTHSEIAAQLDLPPGTVKGRMRLGLQKLRQDVDRVAV